MTTPSISTAKTVFARRCNSQATSVSQPALFKIVNLITIASDAALVGIMVAPNAPN
jgi:hypothetical protein